MPKAELTETFSLCDSSITLKINKTGISQIYNCFEFKYNAQEPEEIYINGKNQNTINNYYNFTETTWFGITVLNQLNICFIDVQI